MSTTLRPTNRRRMLVAPILAVSVTGVLATGCATDSAGGDAGAQATVVQVTSSEGACELTPSSVPVGPVSFEVTNDGSSATEFYAYAVDGSVLGEVEDIGSGLTRDMTVEYDSAGTYPTACKPGMVGDGIAADLEVTD